MSEAKIDEKAVELTTPKVEIAPLTAASITAESITADKISALGTMADMLAKPIELAPEAASIPDAPTPPAPAPEPEAPAKPEPEAVPDPTLEAMRTKLTATTARYSALSAGVPAERVDTLLKLADLSGIDATADDAEAKIGAAIAKALELVPELRATGGGTGGSGEHAREQNKTLTDTEMATLDFRRGLNG